MKKQLFSRRRSYRSHRNRRSIFDWLFKYNERESKDSSEIDSEDRVDVTRKTASSNLNNNQKVSGVKNMNGVPKDFFLVTSSSNMELSKYSTQHSGKPS